MNDQNTIEHLIECILSKASTTQIDTASKGLNLNEVGKHGRTPLSMAAYEGLREVVELLIQNGATVDACNEYQFTALHEASGNGYVEIVRYLLFQGAAVDAETRDGVTPLMCAAAGGHIDVVKLLLENYADPTKIDSSGDTAADIASEKGEDAIANMIYLYLSDFKH